MAPAALKNVLRLKKHSADTIWAEIPIYKYRKYDAQEEVLSSKPSISTRDSQPPPPQKISKSSKIWRKKTKHSLIVQSHTPSEKSSEESNKDEGIQEDSEVLQTVNGKEIQQFWISTVPASAIKSWDGRQAKQKKEEEDIDLKNENSSDQNFLDIMDKDLDGVPMRLSFQMDDDEETQPDIPRNPDVKWHMVQLFSESKDSKKPKSDHPVKIAVKKSKFNSKKPHYAFESEVDEDVDVALKVSKFRVTKSTPRHKFDDICSHAAYNGRLPPDALSTEESRLFGSHLNTLHIQSYLNIRNTILFVWQRQPTVPVTKQDVLFLFQGMGYDSLIKICWQFLIRHGYINFGCVKLGKSLQDNSSSSDVKRKKIVIVGAGMSGISCARHLHNLYCQKSGELPEIIVLEGRNRIGGRINSVNIYEGLKGHAGEVGMVDLGGQIITGFDDGNPVEILIRGQMKLPYHFIKEDCKLYNVDGNPVAEDIDKRAEELSNFLLEKSSLFKDYLEGSKKLEFRERPIKRPKGFPLTGLEENEFLDDELMEMNFNVKNRGVKLDISSQPDVSKYPSLGSTAYYFLEQVRNVGVLSAEDVRAINWHWANLEYANNTNIHNLSLNEWDQDDSHEFSGKHAMLNCGYSKVSEGLAMKPTPINTLLNKKVTAIDYSAQKNDGNLDDEKVTITCADGEQFVADAVVVTLPLGVLKANSVVFTPPFPEYKSKSVQNLGFGVLNKVIMCFDRVFWDKESDLVGCLQCPDAQDLYDDKHVRLKRGRFYLIWNCFGTTGKPILTALMAGDAAENVASEDERDVEREAVVLLRKIYAKNGIVVPSPIKTIITKWQNDEFSKGSYSYIARRANGDDYDNLARSIDNKLFFAGEATIRSHPATIPGAYLSGIRAGRQVFEKFNMTMSRVIKEYTKNEPLVSCKPRKPRRAKTAFGPLVDLLKRREVFENCSSSPTNTTNINATATATTTTTTATTTATTLQQNGVDKDPSRLVL